MLRLRLDVENQALQIEPEIRVGNRELADFPALRDDEGHSPPLVVEVSVLDTAKRSLADAVVEQESFCPGSGWVGGCIWQGIVPLAFVSDSCQITWTNCDRR